MYYGKTKDPQETEDPSGFVSKIYEVGKEYAITINPSDKRQSYRSVHPRARMINADNKLKFYLQEWKDKGIKFKLYPEVSIPSKPQAYNRLHWHGTIKFPTVESLFWYILILRHKIISDNMVVIKPIDDKEKWHAYCTKDINIMKKICKIYKMDYVITHEKCMSSMISNIGGVKD